METLNEEDGKTKDDSNRKFEDLERSLSYSSEFMFPQELNNHLRTQIHNLTAENGALRRCLDEKDHEIQKIRESTGKLCGGFSYGSVFSGVGRASDLAASKIVELSKRVRDLTAELEGERARRQKFEKSELFDEGGASIRKGGRSKDKKRGLEAQKSGEAEESEIQGEKKEDEVKALREKLFVANTKLAEWRNQCQSLRQELKVADKILVSEVGDAATVEAAKAIMGHQSPPNGGMVAWRGRAQQLTLLRHKVSELQDKLNKAERGNEHKDEEGKGEWEELRKECEKNTAEMKRLETSLAEAENQAEDWKRKAEISRARVGALQAEADALRSRMSTILDKAEHDDQLIASLNECLKKKDSFLLDQESEIKSKMENWNKEKKDMMDELMKEKTKVSNMNESINEKDQILEKLKQKLQELTTVSNSRENISQFPQNPSSCWHSTPSEKELQAVAQATEAERLRLLELIEVLNRRLGEEQTQLDHVSKSLRTERQKNARLETMVARMELEMSSSRSKLYSKFSNRKNSSSNEKQLIPEELKYRLEILEEEKLFLESRIECLKQEKDEDLRKYSTMLRETREVFLSTIEEMENSKGNRNAQKTNKFNLPH